MVQQQGSITHESKSWSIYNLLLQKVYFAQLKMLVQLNSIVFIVYSIFNCGWPSWRIVVAYQALSCALVQNGIQGTMNDYDISSGWLVLSSILVQLDSGRNDWIYSYTISLIHEGWHCIFNFMLSIVVFFYFSIIFHMKAFKSINTLGCVFCFLLASTGRALLFCIGAWCCYKNRLREDNLSTLLCWEFHIESSERSILPNFQHCRTCIPIKMTMNLYFYFIFLILYSRVLQFWELQLLSLGMLTSTDV